MCKWYVVVGVYLFLRGLESLRGVGVLREWGCGKCFSFSFSVDTTKESDTDW